MDTRDIVKLAAEAGAKAALEQAEKLRQEQMKRRGDRRLRNTKLLFKNYKLLKKHIEDAIYEKTEIIGSANESASDILDELDGMEGKDYILAIKRSVSRTRIILAHIDKMVSVYQTYCEKSPNKEDLRRWRIFSAYNLDDTPMRLILEKERIDKSTYYRDVREIYSVLSVLLFGVEGLTSVRKR